MAVLEQYCRDGVGLFQLTSLAEQYRFVALLRANDSGGADQRRVGTGEEEVFVAVVVEEADE